MSFLLDPIFRAPLWGTVLMCIAAALMGVILFLQKRSLLTEALSHATYPGVVVAVMGFAWCWPSGEPWVFLGVLVGAFCSSLTGLFMVEWLEKKGKTGSDAALCFTLSVLFGVGVVAMSGLQGAFPGWQRQVNMLLFGQAATMQDIHVVIYGSIVALVVLFFIFSFRSLQVFLFDRGYAQGIGIPIRKLEKMIFLLLLLSLVVGIRSVGIVLISGMTVAPVVAARQFSDRLKSLLGLSALFGGISGLVGTVISAKWALPTGPMIVLCGIGFALGGLLFAPKRGVIFRLCRVVAFRLRCQQENVLKEMWKKGEVGEASGFAIYWLKRQGWIEKKGFRLELTGDGRKRAAAVVRLHRLWELYLAETLGQGIHTVHQNAEEMEHILTPDLEARLTAHLDHPTLDPHSQPIPEKERL